MIKAMAVINNYIYFEAVRNSKIYGADRITSLFIEE